MFGQMAREEREAQEAHLRNRETLDVLRKQMAAMETQKEEAKKLKEEELQLMVILLLLLLLPMMMMMIISLFK